MWSGFLGMVFFIPIYTSPIFICGTFVLTVWVISGIFIKDIRAWVKTQFKIPVILLMLLPWIGLIYTSSTPEDAMGIARKSYYWLFSIAIISVIKTRKKPDIILKMFLAGLSVNSMISMLQFLGIVPLKDGNVTGLFSGSSPWIAFSLLLATGTFIAAFYFFKEQSKEKRILYILLVAQFLFTIGFIGGRSGYLSVIVLSPLLAYQLKRQSNIVKISVIGLIAAVLLFSSPVIMSRLSKIKNDLRQYNQGNVNTSIGMRLHMWAVAISEIRRNPFLGVGTGGFKKSWAEHKKDPALPFFDHPHNSFLYMAVSFGILGLAAFCWLLFLMIKKGWRQRNSAMGVSVLAFTFVFTIGSLTDTQLLTTTTAMVLPIFTGISEAIDVT